MKNFDCYIEDRIVNSYKEIINEGVNLFMRKLIFRFSVGTVLFSTVSFLFFNYYLPEYQHLYMWLFPLSFILIMVICVILFQYLDNKKYLYHGLKLEMPIWRSFQKKAFREYNNIVCRKLYIRLISEGLLLNTKEDIKRLDIYILRFKNKKEKNYRKSVVVSGRISFLVLIITIGIQLISLFFDKNKDSIYDLLLLSLAVSLILGIIYFGLYTISRFWEDVVNRRFETQDRVCDFLELIKINCLLNNYNDVEQKDGSVNIFQCLLKRLLKI